MYVNRILNRALQQNTKCKSLINSPRKHCQIEIVATVVIELNSGALPISSGSDNRWSVTKRGLIE